MEILNEIRLIIAPIESLLISLSISLFALIFSNYFLQITSAIEKQLTLSDFIKRYYPNHDHEEMIELFRMLENSTGQDDYYKLKAMADVLRSNLSSKKKSYSDEMATYDHLETKAIEHLPTGIDLEMLMQSDGEIPERAEEITS